MGLWAGVALFVTHNPETRARTVKEGAQGLASGRRVRRVCPGARDRQRDGAKVSAVAPGRGPAKEGLANLSPCFGEIAISAAAEFIAARVRRRVVLPVAEEDPLGPGQLCGGPPEGQPRGLAEMDLPRLPVHLREPARAARG